ncbi:hypothetical protein N9140_00005 [bacterium]|nr:hypothetical protein [bacterium]
MNGYQLQPETTLSIPPLLNPVVRGPRRLQNDNDDLGTTSIGARRAKEGNDNYDDQRLGTCSKTSAFVGAGASLEVQLKNNCLMRMSLQRCCAEVY